MLALKFLTADGRGPTSKFEWPLPRRTKAGRWIPGRWVTVAGDLKVCMVGVHACLPKFTRAWENDRLFVIELDGDVQDFGDKVVARRGRLLREVEEWRYPAPRLQLSRQHLDEVRDGCRNPTGAPWRLVRQWLAEFGVRPPVTPLTTSAMAALIAEQLPPVLDFEALVREEAA
jgi:hypothetical protein